MIDLAVAAVGVGDSLVDAEDRKSRPFLGERFLRPRAFMILQIKKCKSTKRPKACRSFGQARMCRARRARRRGEATSQSSIVNASYRARKRCATLPVSVAEKRSDPQSASKPEPNPKSKILNHQSSIPPIFRNALRRWIPLPVSDAESSPDLQVVGGDSATDARAPGRAKALYYFARVGRRK